MENMRDWSVLLHDLLVEIAIRVRTAEDFMAFRGVCTSWRAAATKDKFANKSWPRVPLLMLAEKEGSDDREFYSLSRGKICMRLSLPETKGRRLIEARFGWFLTVTYSGDVSLFNPFSGRQIALPSQTTFPEYQYYISHPEYLFIKRAVLSHNPSDTSDFVLMGYFSYCFLGFWRPNDHTWTRVESHVGAFLDVTYYNRKFYAINTSGNIWVWDVSQPDLNVANIILTIDHQLLLLLRREAYLVESSAGELLVISRDGCHYNDASEYGVTNFIVVQLDVVKGQWKRITSLGDDAIFIGYNAGFSVATSTLPNTVKPNCIYFSDDCFEAYMIYLSDEDECAEAYMAVGIGGGKDMGVYNLEDEKIERFNAESLSLMCPPLWIGPSS